MIPFFLMMMTTVGWRWIFCLGLVVLYGWVFNECLAGTGLFDIMDNRNVYLANFYSCIYSVQLKKLIPSLLDIHAV